jgi:hypothetical protein
MPEWVNCTVNGAQVDTYEVSAPIVSVVLADVQGSFIPTMFRVPDIAKREMLAIALAAINSQSQVSALVDDPSQPNAEYCYTMHILAG